MSRKIQKFPMSEFLPPSLQTDKTFRDVADSLNLSFEESDELPQIVAKFSYLDHLDTGLLDHLATGLDADIWREDWDVGLKRSVLKSEIRNKAIRGTLKAVKDAIASIGSAGIVQEWWETEPKGEPHTFTVIADLPNIESLGSANQDELMGLIDNAKPVRSHYKFILRTVVKGDIGVFGVFQAGTSARVTGGYF